MNRKFWAAWIALFFVFILLLTTKYPFILANWNSRSRQSPDPSEILAWLGFGVLVFQVWIAGRQAGIMADQTKILERQTTLSVSINRAFVSVKEFKSYWLHHPEDTERIVSWRITPILENSGNITARKFISWTSFQAHRPKIPENFDYPDIGQSRTFSPALLRAHGTIDGPSIEISVPMLMAVKTKICDIYIWGWAEYSDSLDVKVFKRLEFCNKVVVLGDPKRNDCTFAWHFHTEHNGEDEDCYRRVGERGGFQKPPAFTLNLSIEQFSDFGFTPDDAIT